jgi:hypothetical protein
MAAAQAIAQMRDGDNNDVLFDVLLFAYKQEKASSVRSVIRHVLLEIDKNAQRKLANL